MNGKIFKIVYNGTMKLIPCAETYDRFLSTTASAFSISPMFIRSLTFFYKDQAEKSIPVSNSSDYATLMNTIGSSNLKTIKLTVGSNEELCKVNTESEFEIVPIQEINVEAIDSTVESGVSTESNVEEFKIQNKKRKNRPKKGTMEYELLMARKEVKRIVKKELYPIKTKLFNEMYQKVEAQIRAKYIVDENLKNVQQAYAKAEEKDMRKAIMLDKNEENLFTTQYRAKLESECLNSSLAIETRNNKTSTKTILKLKNTGKVNWPNPCFLKCIENQSQIKGETIKLSNVVEPQKEIDIDVIFDLTNVNTNGTYISKWQLQNENRAFFGQIFTFEIKCIYDNTLKIKEEFIETQKEEKKEKKEIKGIPYYDILEEMKNEFEIGIIEDDNTIMNALIRNKGNKIKALNEMLDNLNENAVNFNDSLSSIDNQIKYMDLLEEIKKDIKANENDIINALISTNGNKAEAKKLLI